MRGFNWIPSLLRRQCLAALGIADLVKCLTGLSTSKRLPVESDVNNYRCCKEVNQCTTSFRPSASCRASTDEQYQAISIQFDHLKVVSRHCASGGLAEVGARHLVVAWATLAAKMAQGKGPEMRARRCGREVDAYHLMGLTMHTATAHRQSHSQNTDFRRYLYVSYPRSRADWIVAVSLGE